MQKSEWHRYKAVELTNVPTLDRFFPHCTLGLVEFFARAQWELPDLKKIWFASTFEYKRASAPSWLAANQIELAGRIKYAGDVEARSFLQLDEYYGITIESLVFSDYSKLFDHVHECLQRKAPVITSFDMSLLQGERRAKGLFQPHMVSVVGWDAHQGVLKLVEQVKGKLAIPCSQFEESFKRYTEHRKEVCVLRCSRRPGHVTLPLRRDVVHAQINQALQNLYSDAANLGLNALTLLAADVVTAAQAEKKAFVIPGLWVFSHDRHALLKGLPYWRQAGIAKDDQLTSLHSVLDAAFQAWFEIDMMIERALYEQDPGMMNSIAEAIRQVSGIEAQLAALLRSVVSA
jgi:hypothetical protein